MREIKFRVWNTDYNEMWSWKDVKQSTPFQYVEEAKNIIFLQYTGLNDKNGVEIYEGDLLKNNETWEVIYAPTLARFVVRNSCGEEENMSLLAILKFEVVGNIYENKN